MSDETATTTTPPPGTASPAVPEATPGPEAQAAPASPVAPVPSAAAPTLPAEPEGDAAGPLEAPPGDDVEGLKAQLAAMQAAQAARDAKDAESAERLTRLEADNAALRKDARERALTDAKVPANCWDLVPDTFDFTTKEGKAAADAWLAERPNMVTKSAGPPEPRPMVSDKSVEILNKVYGITDRQLKAVR